MPGRAIAHGRIYIDQIPIGVMLDHEAVDVPPIIENLAAQDMTPDAPDGGVLLLGEPLVSQGLRVEVVHLKARVVDVLLDARGKRRHEKRVVVDQVLAAVDMAEQRDLLAHGPVGFRVDLVQRHVQDVRGHDVEVLRVPFHLGREVFDVQTEVAQLNKRRH